ncbi:MAG: monovalent cation/H+ antiporter subunit D family protein [Desulfosarcinaceae bacterium]|nr:monovalent cation/H+ antiporter subunit D family protein [Desulfosarcinaceae bacterium]
MTSQLPAFIILLPLTAAFGAFFAGWWFRKAVYPLVVGVLGLCVLLAGGILHAVFDHGSLRYFLGGWPPPVGIELHVDSLGAFMLTLVSSLSLLAAIYAKPSVETELADRVALFWSLYLLLTTGMLGILITGDVFNLFVLLEVASLSGYALVGIGRGQALLASFRYLIIGTIGASFYLIGIGYLYAVTGSLNMVDLGRLLPPLYGTRAVQAAFIFILTGFAIKIALFPLHAWQPDAYTYAPSGISVLIASAMAKTSLYALIRLLFAVFTVDFITVYRPLFNFLGWMAALSMIAGSIFAIRQRNFKRMLAYSSVANVGYIVLAIALVPATLQGLAPALVHILNHAVIKACMFMAAGAFIYRFDRWDIGEFTGLGRRMPWTSFALLLAILAMIGMPPSAGFVTKWYLVLAIIEAKQYPMVAAVFFSTLLMIVYFWRVVEIIYVRPERSPVPTAVRVEEVPLSMRVPCVALGIATFAIGPVWMAGILTPVVTAVNTAFGLGGQAP